MQLMSVDARDVRVGDLIGIYEQATVVSVQEKHGKFRGKNGGPYTVYIIKDDAGNSYRLAPYSSVWVRR